MIDFNGIEWTNEDMVEWNEPHELYGDVIIAAAVKDIIKFQKQYVLKIRPDIDYSDITALEDFIVVNWAWKRKT